MGKLNQQGKWMNVWRLLAALRNCIFALSIERYGRHHRPLPDGDGGQDNCRGRVKCDAERVSTQCQDQLSKATCWFFVVAKLFLEPQPTLLHFTSSRIIWHWPAAINRLSLASSFTRRASSLPVWVTWHGQLTSSRSHSRPPWPPPDSFGPATRLWLYPRTTASSPWISLSRSRRPHSCIVPTRTIATRRRRRWQPAVVRIFRWQRRRLPRKPSKGVWGHFFIPGTCIE